MNRFFGLLVAVVVLTAAFVGAAGTASAASKATYYLSLGDSLAGGAAKQYPDQLFNAVRNSDWSRWGAVVKRPSA